MSMFERLLDGKNDAFAQQLVELSNWWEGVRDAHTALIADNERLLRELAEARSALERLQGGEKEG